MGYVDGMSHDVAGEAPSWSEVVRVRAPAKVNLALCVGARASDGYHPLRTIFQAVSLWDEVTATPAPGGVLDVVVEGRDASLVPTDGTDLTVRAAALLRQRCGTPGLGAHLHVAKAIPVAAGLAGGSADAAAALLACSVLWDLDTDPEMLAELGAELGSDVPFALLGGTALGTGRGSDLLPLLTRGRYQWVLAFAHRTLSTPAVYQRFDELIGCGRAELPAGLLEALVRGDAAAAGLRLANDLQGPAVDLYPELGQTLAFGTVLHGVLGSLVSGSGPTCAFLCADARSAAAVADRLAELPAVRATRLVAGAVPGAQLLS